MSYDNIRRELEKLSAAAPKGIILHLLDGSTYKYPPCAPQEFLHAVLETIRSKEDTPLRRALSRCEQIEGFGRMGDLFRSWAEGEALAARTAPALAPGGVWAGHGSSVQEGGRRPARRI